MSENIELFQELDFLINSYKELDQNPAFPNFQHQFFIPLEGEKVTHYFCGHSLGLQPKTVQTFVNQELETWKKFGVDGHFSGKNPWFSYHKNLTPYLSLLTGSMEKEVVAMNSLTVNIHLLLASFFKPSIKKYKILIDTPSFSSDYYAITSQIKFHGLDVADTLIELTPRTGEYILRTEDILKTIEENKQDITLIWMSGVNYLTGQFYDIKSITELAKNNGIYVGLDLAHAIGNVVLNLHDWGVDFATWCSYKYLNAGPGSVSGIYVHEKYSKHENFPNFKGWWGFDEKRRFEMLSDFIPQEGAEAWQLSNPAILPMASLWASLEIFKQAGIENLRKKSEKMSEMIFKGIALINQKVPETGLQIITPDNEEERGCQVSFKVTNNGRKFFDYLTYNKVIADWRTPDIIRIAPVPLYNTFEDIGAFLQLVYQYFNKP